MTAPAPARPMADKMTELSWRIYVLALGLGFFVVVEPAPTDLVFVVAVAVFCFSRPILVPFLSGTAILGVFLYCFFSFLSLIYVEYIPLLALRAVGIEFYMIGLFVLTAYFARTRGDQAFFVILSAFAIGAILASLITAVALLELVPNPEIFYRDEHAVRIQATFKDPNVFGPYLVPSILFVVWIALESARFRMIAVAVLGMYLMSLISTYSRGAWVHAVISISAFSVVMLYYRRTAQPMLSGVIWLTIAVLLCVMVFLDQITARLADSFLAKRVTLQSYDQDRFSHLFQAIGVIWEHPFGIGPFQARPKYGYLPHNTFIAFAMSNGILASLGLALIYGASMTRCAAKVLDQKPGWTKYAMILSVVLGLLALMQVVGSGHWRHLYIICGLAFGSYGSNSVLPETWKTGQPLRIAGRRGRAVRSFGRNGA